MLQEKNSSKFFSLKTRLSKKEYRAKMKSPFTIAQFFKFKKMTLIKEGQYQKILLRFQVLKIVNLNKMTKRNMTSWMRKT